MKSRFTLFFMFLSCILHAQTSSWYNTAQSRIDTLRKGNFSIVVLDVNAKPIQDSIRVIHKKHEFPWGTSIDLSYPTPSTLGTSNDDWLKANMLKYFNYGVCGNQFKWSGIEAAGKGNLTYLPFENTLAWFNKVGWKMRAHTLLWGGYNNTDYHCIPKWVMDLSTNPKQMYAECQNRVTREVTRYKGKVKEYDVLNEPTHATTLQGFVGDSIDWNCFKWAHAADPDARFFVNDYNIIEWQDQTNNFITLIKKMLKNGAPISGIGTQCHIGESVDVVNYKARIDQLAQFGLPVKVTEFDMNATNVSQQKYAIEMAKMMRLAFSHPAIDGFIFWGLTEPTWAKGIVNIIREDRTTRLAADTVYNLIHNVWTTKLAGKTDVSGIYSFNGYFGDYEVQAKVDGIWKKFSASCLKENKNGSITLNGSNGEALSPVLKKIRIVASKGVELTFDKPMANPASNALNFKVFDVASNYVKSATLKTGDSTTILLTMVNTTNIKEKNYLPVSYYPGTVASADGGKLEVFGPILDSRITPAFQSAKTSTDGNLVAVAFDKKILSSSVNMNEFVVKKNGRIITISQAQLNNTNDTLKLGIASQVTDTTDVLTVSYTPGALMTMDSLYVTNFTSRQVVNSILVTKFVSATTTYDGKTVQANFNTTLLDPTGSEANFTLIINRQPVALNSVKLLTTNKKCIIITPNRTIFSGDTVNLSLNRSALFTSTLGMPVLSFTAKVTNRSNILSSVESVNEKSVLCYPIPFDNQLKLEGIGGFSHVTIYNQIGIRLIDKNITSDNMNIETFDLSSGLYLIEFSNSERRFLKKIMKK